MIKKYNTMSLVSGIPGIFLQITGIALYDMADSISEGFSYEFAGIGILLFSLGTAMIVMSMYYYSKSKGRNAAWCIAGVLSILGVIALSVLEDRSENARYGS